jgi:DNA uptake protein ComE-like DNA-binding protein
MNGRITTVAMIALGLAATAIALGLGTPAPLAQDNTGSPGQGGRLPNGAPSSLSDPQKGLVDINTAPLTQLAALPRIGNDEAQAIVDHRPYLKKDQLLTRNVLPRGTYEAIQDKIIARQMAK